MGLDLALGLVVLFAAFRGWIQGFIHQAVRIAGLIACIYLADPVRQFAKPYILPHLSSIQPDLIDRILWWTAAAISYFVLVGIALSIAKMANRPEPPGAPKGGRNDQFAGFLLGGVKGLLIAVFLTAGIEKYALERLKTMPWAAEQTSGSYALKWNDQYHPAPRIWQSQPVQELVMRVRRMGLQGPDEADHSPGGDSHAAPSLRTADGAGASRDAKAASDLAESEKAARTPTSPLSGLDLQIDQDREDTRTTPKPPSPETP